MMWFSSLQVQSVRKKRVSIAEIRRNFSSIVRQTGKEEEVFVPFFFNGREEEVDRGINHLFRIFLPLENKNHINYHLKDPTFNYPH